MAAPVRKHRPLTAQQQRDAISLAQEVQSAVMNIKLAVRNNTPIDPEDFVVVRGSTEALAELVQYDTEP